MYQGLQGALAGLISSMLPAASAAMLEIEIVVKESEADQPFPGERAYAKLMWWDALFLASLTPLILETLKGQRALAGLAFVGFLGLLLAGITDSLSGTTVVGPKAKGKAR